MLLSKKTYLYFLLSLKDIKVNLHTLPNLKGMVLHLLDILPSLKDMAQDMARDMAKDMAKERVQEERAANTGTNELSRRRTHEA